MLYLFSTVVLLLSSSTTLFAQNQMVDSLEIELETATADTTKLLLLQKLTNLYRNKNTEKTIAYALEGIPLAEKHADYKKLVSFNITYGQQLSVIGHMDSAFFFIEKAASYLPKISEPRFKGFVLLEHAKLLNEKGDVTGAIEKYLELLKIGEKIDHYQIILAAHVGLVGLFSVQKLYPEAIKYSKLCEGLCPKLPAHRKSYCYGLVYNNLSQFYFRQNKVDSALYYSLQSVELREKEKNINGLSHSYTTIGHIYIKKKDTLSAIVSYEKAISASRKIKNIANLSNALLMKSIVDLSRKNASALKNTFEELDSLMPQVQSHQYWINYYLIKTGWYKLQKNYKQALIYNDKKFKLVDSLRNEKNATLISTLETKYETNKHKIEKDLAEKETILSNERANQSRQNTISIAIFAGIISLLLLYILSRLQIIKQQKTALDAAYLALEKSNKNEVALLSLKALQAQMNPHFIFNALNSIQDLVLQGDTKNSARYLGKFSDLIRKILLSSKEQFIPLDQELEMLGLYLDLETLRLGPDLELTFNSSVPSDLEAEIFLPAMFIQPYIENAIKHGLFHKVGEKKLFIEFSLVNNHLQCIIEDNGVGQEKANEMKEKLLHLHTGFSTEAINHRVQFLNQTLSKKIHIETKDLIETGQPLGTRITLLFSI